MKFRPQLQGLEDRLALSTVQNFDDAGSAFVAAQHPGGMGPAPAPVAGGPTGNFMRLASTAAIPDHGAISFARTDAGAAELVVADFDFRITPVSADTNRADGFSFIFLKTADHLLSGVRNPPNVAEEPNFAGSLGVGFDIHDAGPDEINNNHVSIHFNGVKIGETDVSQVLDLASGRVASSGFAHARIIMRPASSDVTVILTPAGGIPYTVINRMFVNGFTPYEGRVQFSARSGGEAANFDLDNVSVQYLNQTQVVLSFRSRSSAVSETGGFAVLTVERAGNTQSQVSVAFATTSGSATAQADFATTNGTLVFPSGVVQQSIQVPIFNDGLHEGLAGVENFRVTLNNATGGAVIGQADSASVNIVDDERGREVGHWGDILDGPDVVGVHLHLLPTGQVMFWDRTGKASLWSPVTNTISAPALPDPPYDIFCSGHNFLADGTLFVTGGHEAHDGDPDFDGDGLDFASVYNPFTNSWARLPDMLTGGRWYPTNTILANGNVSVVSGSVDHNFTENKVPQVWQTQLGAWRDLTTADGPDYPTGVDLYPRNFLDPTDPDGTRIFRAGPDRDTKFLETTGPGAWSDGPDSQYGNRTYGTAVMFEPGKILIAGGDVLPTNTAEVIDLNGVPLQWKTVATAYPAAVTPDMAFDRRHLNSTMLPDGTVLVTGGSSGDGFDDDDPIFAAEMWDPDTGNWTTWDDMQIRRHYHGAALLLPDGRVLSMGGGDGGAVQDQTSFEIFSPPYLFRGPRPQITSSPDVTSYGRTFFVQTPDAASISAVSLVRLGSVTHGFDQNQRFITLAAPTQAAGGVNVTVPAGPNIAPPGHYMMFLLNTEGVPSVAEIIQVVDDRVTTGAGAGGGPHVRTFDPAIRTEHRSFFAYSSNFTGGVRVAKGDINGDGTPDNITGAGPGGGPHVRVFDGRTGEPLAGPAGSFFAYHPNFTGGVFVASGDVNGDGRDDIVTGAGAGGGPHVRVFSGMDGSELFGLFAYDPNFSGGVTVAVGDVNNDGLADIVTGAGAGGGPHVRVFSGATRAELFGFFAYHPNFTGGVFVAAGDVNGDDRADVYTGAGAGGGPHVRVFSGMNQAELHSFFAYNPLFAGGVRVAAADLDDDGRDDIITGAGPGGGPHVRGFSGVNVAGLVGFFAYNAAFTGGVFVAGMPVGDSALRLAGDGSDAVPAAEALSAEQLEPIRAAAISRWDRLFQENPNSLSRTERNALADVRLAVAELPGDLLGLARGGLVLIDRDAAGRGWFVDPTPNEDEEFLLADGRAVAPMALGRIDLLTVVLHEFGHVLGLEHDHAAGAANDLMLDELSSEVRRLPVQRLIDELFAQWQ